MSSTNTTTNTTPVNGNGAFEPQIVAFLCKWCTYAGADLAGTSRMVYPPNVRALMLPCTGRIDIAFVLRAFLQGADGVLVSGCHPGDCHYTAGNFRARRRWILLRDLLDVLGFDLRRLEMAWISAAEGAKFVKTVQTFTSRIRDLGPYTSLKNIAARRMADPAPDVMSALLAPAPKDGSTETDPALIAAARDALAEGRIKAIVGWVRNWTLNQARPMWLTTPEEAERLVCPADHPANLARFLKNAPLEAFRPIGVVARRSELMALNVLLQEQQINPADVVAFTVGPDGTFQGATDLETATATLVSEPARQLPADRPAGFSDAVFDRLDELMAQPPEQRWAFWTDQFSHCVKCYACRGACPMCTCDTCFADKNRPQWFPTAADGPGNLSWHIVRAFHLAGRCVGCGACEAACPAGVPLNLLGAALSRSAQQHFNYRAGVDAKVPPLQSDFRADDKEDFIV